MDKTLLWTALVLGGLGSFVSLVPSFGGGKTNGARLPLLAWIVALALPIIVLLGSMPSHAPFSAGQMWGRGFFIGGIAGLAAAAALVQGLLNDKPGARFALAGQLFAAIASCGIAVHFFRPDVVDGLTGVAIGWLCEATLLYALLCGVNCLAVKKSQIRQQLLIGAGYAATLAATIGLGVLRGSPTGEPDRWPGLALALSAATAAIVLLASAPSKIAGSVLFRIPGARALGGLGARLFRMSDNPESAAQAITAIIVCAVHVLLAWMLSKKIDEAGPVFSTAAAGAVAGLLCWWISSERKAESGQSGFPPVAALVLVAGAMLSFGRFTGLGVGLFALAFWVVALLATPQSSTVQLEGESSTDTSDEAATPHHSLVNAGIAVTILVLYRLVTSRFTGDIRGVSITDQFALFAVIIGAFAPGAIANVLAKRESEGVSPIPTVFRLALIGVATLALPGMMLLVWGSKVALALLIGLSLSALAPWGNGAAKRLTELPALVAVGMALALSQWSHHILAISDLARAEKAKIALIGLAVIIAAIVLDDLATWAASSRKRQEA